MYYIQYETKPAATHPTTFPYIAEKPVHRGSPPYERPICVQRMLFLERVAFLLGSLVTLGTQGQVKVPKCEQLVAAPPCRLLWRRR